MRGRNFLPIIVLVICAAMFFYCDKFFLQPVQNEILNMQLETRRLKNLERELDELKRRHKNLAEYEKLIDERLTDAKNFLPEDADSDKFAAGLYAAADSNKILLTDVNFGAISLVDENSKSEAKINLQRQEVNITVEGDYISMLNFIRRILDGERFARLESFSINDSGKNFLSGNFDFLIYSTTKINSQKK